MGKGSVPRPFDVPQEEFLSNWDRIFGKKDNKPEDKKQDKDAPKENAK